MMFNILFFLNEKNYNIRIAFDYNNFIASKIFSYLEKMSSFEILIYHV